jgi:hypothetical protein
LIFNRPARCRCWSLLARPNARRRRWAQEDSSVVTRPFASEAANERPVLLNRPARSMAALRPRPIARAPLVEGILGMSHGPGRARISPTSPGGRRDRTGDTHRPRQAAFPPRATLTTAVAASLGPGRSPRLQGGVTASRGLRPGPARPALLVRPRRASRCPQPLRRPPDDHGNDVV